MPGANVGMLVFPDYTWDNDLWIQLQDYQHYDRAQLLTLWRSVNLHIDHIADCIDQSKLDNYRIDYQGNRCTLGQKIEGYLSHIKLHIGKIYDLAQQIELHR